MGGAIATPAPPLLTPLILIYKWLGYQLGLPFIDVGVDRFPPNVREWLKEKTGKTSVPQIFFNKTHVGGNAEFQALIKA